MPTDTPSEQEPSFEAITASIKRISDTLPDEPGNAEIMAGIDRLQRSIDAIMAHLGLPKP